MENKKWFRPQRQEKKLERAFEETPSCDNGRPDDFVRVVEGGH